MSDELERLKNAMNAATPSPDDTARDRAISAGMEEFEKNFQGSTAPARPTPEQSQWWALIASGVSNMFRRLTTRETLLATASIATFAIAFVVTYDGNPLPKDNHGPIVLSEDGIASGGGLAPIDKLNVGADEVSQMQIADAEEIAVERLDDSGFGASIVLNLEIDENGEIQSTGSALATGGSSPDMSIEESVVIDGIASTTTSANPVEANTLSKQAEEQEEGAVAYVAPAAPVMTEERAPVGRLMSNADLQPQIIAAEPAFIPEANTEQYPDAAVNPLKITSQDPVSTFSIDVDTASYGIVRSSLMDGYLPPSDAVRTEELINYFSYDYPLPQAGEAPFSTSVTVMDTPWNADTKLLHIGIQGYDLPIEDRPPVNLVFLIDTSGSMSDADKLPLLINSFRLMLSNLQPDDQVAIVTYAGSAGMALEPTSASESAKILASLQSLHAGGSTAGQAGLQQAYALAEQMADGNEATGRVILATDGDFNVGISDPTQLQEFVEEKRDTGVYLSVLGFGRGNYNDTIMQTLAQNGNGTAAYIDTLAEAQKVLVDQIGGALFTIAQDVKIQIEFNPAEIAEYRLIGYETRALNREDFNNDAVDAGEIGSGHSVTAIYEITPVGSPAISVDDLRYAESEATPATAENGEYAFLKLRYKKPGEEVSNLITTPVFPDADANLANETNFAAAVAGFSQILRNDSRIRGWDIADAITLAQSNKGEDPFGYRAEFITLMRLADSLK